MKNLRALSALSPHLALQKKLSELCPRGVVTDFSGSVASFGQKSDLEPEVHAQLEAFLREWIPWKKGPFSFFGIDVDSEWRSDLKWNRLLGHIPELSGATVADIGCNNGYYMLRMLGHDPKRVDGFDPVEKYACQFAWMQHLYGKDWPLKFCMQGVESLDEHKESYDVIFCLGILQTLKTMREALRPGGYLIIDCQGIEAGDHAVVFPQGKYAGAKGFWFLPSRGALESWVSRSGLRDIKTFFSEKLLTTEQRATAWAPHYDLGSMLSKDGLQTTEGYPAPWRHYLICRR